MEQKSSSKDISLAHRDIAFRAAIQRHQGAGPDLVKNGAYGERLRSLLPAVETAAGSFLGIDPRAVIAKLQSQRERAVAVVADFLARFDSQSERRTSRPRMG